MALQNIIFISVFVAVWFPSLLLNLTSVPSFKYTAQPSDESTGWFIVISIETGEHFTVTPSAAASSTLSTVCGISKLTSHSAS